MTPRLMNTGLASHLILAGNTLKKKPDTCSLEEHHQRFYPRDTYYRANATLWLVSLNHPWPLIGQEEDGWSTGHRSSFTPILDTRESEFSAPQTQSVIIHFNNPASSKMQASIVSFYESFFNENDRASNTRNSVWTQRLQNALHPTIYTPPLIFSPLSIY